MDLNDGSDEEVEPRKSAYKSKTAILERIQNKRRKMENNKRTVQDGSLYKNARGVIIESFIWYVIPC
jgi:hypothetical protein